MPIPFRLHSLTRLHESSGEKGFSEDRNTYLNGHIACYVYAEKLTALASHAMVALLQWMTAERPADVQDGVSGDGAHTTLFITA